MTDTIKESNNRDDYSRSHDLAGSAPWCGSEDEIDSEVYELVHLVEEGWAWQWPGWQWVADRLNHWHKNDRTASACRQKYNRVLSARTLSQNVEVERCQPTDNENTSE